MTVNAVNTVSTNESKKSILKPTLIGAGIGAGLGAGLNYVGQKTIIAQPDKFITQELKEKATKSDFAKAQLKQFEDLVKAGKINKKMLGIAALVWGGVAGAITALVKYFTSKD